MMKNRYFEIQTGKIPQKIVQNYLLAFFTIQNVCEISKSPENNHYNWTHLVFLPEDKIKKLWLDGIKRSMRSIYCERYVCDRATD